MTYLAKYYFYTECETCENPVEYGSCLTSNTKNGYPVINIHEVGGRGRT